MTMFFIFFIMKTIYKFLFLFLVALFVESIFAQTIVTSKSYETDFEDEAEQVTEPEIIDNKIEITEKENSSKNATEDKKEKKKVEKTSKSKRIFGKNKKKNDSEEETIKIVSLADLKKESE